MNSSKKSLKELLFTTIFPISNKVRKKLKKDYLEQYIYSYYPNKSIQGKRFYNIGAGNQRSKYDIWSYVDLESAKYSKEGIDVFFDLESLGEMPIDSNSAEIIFSSFVIEHISTEATKNLCREAYRTLKKGGVFHSKVHCYEYAYRLLQKNLISPKIPFECRESSRKLRSFVKRHNSRVCSYFNDNKEYVVESKKKPGEKIIFSPSNSFLYHNVTSIMEDVENYKFSAKEIIESTNDNDIKKFYNNLKNNYVNKEKAQPHQHNADYFPKEELYEYIKSLGFSEVYFTSPYQSVSPALWEKALNPIHTGFGFAIEAVK